MKTLSAGIIFMTEDKDLFMGRVTGSRKPGMMAHRWDIPKGRVESSDLNALEAAKRECLEETGFSNYNPDLLEDQVYLNILVIKTYSYFIIRFQ